MLSTTVPMLECYTRRVELFHCGVACSSQSEILPSLEIILFSEKTVLWSISGSIQSHIQWWVWCCKKQNRDCVFRSSLHLSRLCKQIKPAQQDKYILDLWHRTRVVFRWLARKRVLFTVVHANELISKPRQETEVPSVTHRLENVVTGEEKLTPENLSR